MNILLYDFGSYIQPDLVEALKNMGHNCKTISYMLSDRFHDDYFEKYISMYLETGNYDCVMSTNFHPVLAQLCYDHQIKYLAWCYDSPMLQDCLEYYALPTSYTFLFDRNEVQFFRNRGIENIYYLPLAINTKRLAQIPITENDIAQYSCDISFIGQFYKSPLSDVLQHQSNYLIGFINALTDAQFKIYGYNFIDEIITDEFINNINNACARQNIVYYTEYGAGLNKAALLLSMNKQITRNERIILLKLLSEFCKVHLYSTEHPDLLKDVPFMGTAAYYTEMPKIFRLSKINLNPTLRSIQSGITLRSLDIIGSGGFLLSNFQPDFLEFFRPDQDIVMYESIEDALDKAKYYLFHEEKRQQIMQNAYHIVEEHFAYLDKIHKMFQTADLL